MSDQEKVRVTGILGITIDNEKCFDCRKWFDVNQHSKCPHCNQAEHTEQKEKIFQLEEAQEHIRHALLIIGNIVGDLEDAPHYEAYLMDPLCHIADGTGNPYDECLPKLIEKIRSEE